MPGHKHCSFSESPHAIMCVVQPLNYCVTWYDWLSDKRYSWQIGKKEGGLQNVLPTQAHCRDSRKTDNVQAQPPFGLGVFSLGSCVVKTTAIETTCMCGPLRKITQT